MNIKHNIPLVGQKQPDQQLVLQALAVITPELQAKLDAWCNKIGLPHNEVQNTIFRLGLIVFSLTTGDPGEVITEDQATELIPLTENEKKVFRTDG